MGGLGKPTPKLSTLGEVAVAVLTGSLQKKSKLKQVALVVFEIENNLHSKCGMHIF